ncbi:PTS system%2C maltose and glucose-specific IIABC component [Salmonella enterica subsp. enterica serovar Typhi]|nr:PTS system%2C maltose and glucose-specific IIABC component [Salmonella enterica subsp. enterica serovar Typhi]
MVLVVSIRRHGKHRESGQLHPPLRLSVKDMSFVDVQALKDNHATGIVQLNQHNLSFVDVQALKDNHATGIVQLNQHNLQVIIGPQVQSVKDEMVGLMNTVQA